MTDHLDAAKGLLNWSGTVSPEMFAGEATPFIVQGCLHALIAIAEGKAAELRPVEFTIAGPGCDSPIRIRGWFHEWIKSPEYGECAKVEGHRGYMHFPLAGQVRFLDRQNEPADDEPEFPYCPQCGGHHDPALMNTTDCKTW